MQKINYNNSAVKVAVLPVAGLGTRFLPATKSSPKELLPIVDKPSIQYVVDEAIEVGITQFIFITSGSKRAIEDYFDRNYELEARLANTGKTTMLEQLRKLLPTNVDVAYVRQADALGLGHAVLRAKALVGNQAFALLLADDVMELGAGACLAQMLETYEATKSSVLAVENIDKKDTHKYGIVKLSDNMEQPINSNAHRIEQIVEKPKPTEAPSTLGVTGRYILTPEIFTYLEKTAPGVNGEIQLTDAIAMMMADQSVYVNTVQGKRFDCGDSLGLLKATLHFALARSSLRADLINVMQDLLTQYK